MNYTKGDYLMWIYPNNLISSFNAGEGSIAIVMKDGTSKYKGEDMVDISFIKIVPKSINNQPLQNDGDYNVKYFRKLSIEEYNEYVISPIINNYELY